MCIEYISIPFSGLSVFRQPCVCLRGIWHIELCHYSWIDRSQFFRAFGSILAASKDGALLCSTAFLFSPCAPHTASTLGLFPELLNQST